MTEELINALTKLKGLKVVSRTSVFKFKGNPYDIREIGKSLDVGAVLEGSVRKAVNKLRITAQLINVSNGYHLWSETYDARMDDIFAIQEQISEAIALCPPDFTFLSGDDAMTLPLVACGGRGVISTCSNVAPVEMVKLVGAARCGDFDEARNIHQRLLPLFDVLFCETNPIPVKAAVAMQRDIEESLRLPLTSIGDANRERLQVTLKELGLL